MRCVMENIDDESSRQKGTNPASEQSQQTYPFQTQV